MFAVEALDEAATRATASSANIPVIHGVARAKRLPLRQLWTIGVHQLCHDGEQEMSDQLRIVADNKIE